MVFNYVTSRCGFPQSARWGRHHHVPRRALATEFGPGVVCCECFACALSRAHLPSGGVLPPHPIPRAYHCRYGGTAPLSVPALAAPNPATRFPVGLCFAQRGQSTAPAARARSRAGQHS